MDIRSLSITFAPVHKSHKCDFETGGCTDQVLLGQLKITWTTAHTIMNQSRRMAVLPNRDKMYCCAIHMAEAFEALSENLPVDDWINGD